MKRFDVRQAMWALCVLAILWIPLAASGDESKAVKKPKNAAMVNGTPIAYQDFEWELGFYKKRLAAQGKPVPENIGAKERTEVLEDMVSRELLRQEGVKAGIKVEDKWLQEELSAFQTQFGDHKKYEEKLAELKITEEQLKQHFSQRQIVREFIGKEIVPKINIPEADATAFYKENPTLFMQPEEAKAQHILIKVEPSTTDAQKAEARKKLTDIKKRIDKGEDFGALAKENSQCPSAAQNGDLGSFSKGRMVPAFEKAAFALKPNQVSDIIETQFGYHLIKLNELKPAHQVSFDEAKSRIMNDLRNKKIQAESEKYAEGLRKKAKVESFIN